MKKKSMIVPPLGHFAFNHPSYSSSIISSTSKVLRRRGEQVRTVSKQVVKARRRLF